MLARDVNKVIKALNVLIHRGIQDSVTLVVDKCTQLNTSPEEPDFIASLVLNFTPRLLQTLRDLFPDTKFSVTGIYCHQKPIVNIDESKNPELGDLLFVYIHTDARGVMRYNSLLFQAKKSRNVNTRVSASDQHQLKLYTEWPAFTYLRAGRLNGKKRNVLPKTMHDGAQYLLIDDDPETGLAGYEGTFPMGCATPAELLCLNADLATELVDFLKFKAGRAFEALPNQTEDDWTKMIWEVLEILKDKASRRKNIGISNFPRITTQEADGLCFTKSDRNLASFFQELQKDLWINGDGGNHEPYFEREEQNDGAPSLILIESSERREG